MTKVYLSFLFITLISCSESDKRKNSIELAQKTSDEVLIVSGKPLFEINFEKNMSFGDGEDVFFGGVGEFAVDKTNRVYIADGKQIRVFNQNGEYLKSLGREGRGPGEFMNFGGLFPQIGYEKLFAYDEVQSRINLFDLENLVPDYSIPINSNNWNKIKSLSQSKFERYFIASDSLIIAGFTEIKSRFDSSENICRYYLMNQEGEIVSNEIFNHVDNGLYDGNGVPGPINMRVVFPIPVDRSSIIDVDKSGNIYWAWTEHIKINVYDSNGKKTKSVQFPKEKVRLDFDQMQDHYSKIYGNSRQVVSSIRERENPQTWPAMDYFFVDDEERMWISTITESDDNFEWIVISKSGEYLAKCEWKGSRNDRITSPREIKLVKNNYLYTQERDEETKLTRVVRYKIRFDEI